MVIEALPLGEPSVADALLEPLRRLGPITDTIALVPTPALSHLQGVGRSRQPDPLEPSGAPSPLSGVSRPVAAADSPRSRLPVVRSRTELGTWLLRMLGLAPVPTVA